MAKKQRHQIILASVVLTGLLAGLTAGQSSREIDFEYRCIIVNSPSTTDQSDTLPEAVTKIPVDSVFYVEFWATDSGSTNTGITSAYADLDYPEECITAGEVVHTDLFDLFTDGTNDGSLIDELGGSQLDPDIGVEPEWARIAYVEFTCSTTCGSAYFELAPATSESAAHNRGLIPTSDISYGSCSVMCGNAPIPAVSEWGLVLMTLLVLTAGTLVFTRPEMGRSSLLD